MQRSSNICKGDFISYHDHVYIIKEREFYGRGKHGESFYKFVGKDIVTHESRTIMGRYRVHQLLPTYDIYTVNSVGTHVNVTRPDGSTADLPIPEGELGTTISDLYITEPECKVGVTRVGNVEIITKVY